MAKSEKTIQTELMVYLSQFGIPMRLNSGKAYQGDYVGGMILNPRVIKLCPEGTADILLILNGGKVLWIECKTKKGKQRESQIRFQNEMLKLGHSYVVGRSVEEIKKEVENENKRMY